MNLDFEYSYELGSETKVDLDAVERELHELDQELDGPAEVIIQDAGNDLEAKSGSPGKSREFNEIKAKLDEDTAEIYTAGDNYKLSPAATSLMAYLEDIYTETIEGPDISNWRKTTL